MYKKVLGIALATVMTFSVATGVAGAKGSVEDLTSYTTVSSSATSDSYSQYICGTTAEAVNGYEAFQKYTFEEFSKDFKKGLDSKVIEKAKQLFENAMKLEEQGKYEKATQIWNEIEKLDLFDYEVIDMGLISLTFEEFSKQFKKDIDTKTLDKAKDLFNQAIKLEKESKYDEACEIWDNLYKLDVFDYSDLDVVNYTMTFEDLAKEFKKDVSKEDIAKAKAIYEKIVKLEEESKYDESNELWNQLYELKIFKDYEVCIIKMTFEDFSQGFKKDVKKADVSKAKDLFERIMKLEEDGKFDDANELWKQLYELDLFDYDEKIIDMEPMTFEDFSADFKKDIKPEVLSKAKELYSKIVKSEKANKFEETDRLWNELYDLDLFDMSKFDEEIEFINPN